MSDATTMNDDASRDGCAPAAPAPPPELRTIEDLRRHACTDVARSLAQAFGPGNPRGRFDAAMELAERIAERACRFLNSLYLHSARDLHAAAVPQVEQRLRELGRKNLSFGDYVSSMELFLKEMSPATLHPGVKAEWDAFAAPLRSATRVGEDLAALEAIKQAREGYEIPVASLERYVKDHLKPNAPTKQPIAAVLRLAATYRNAKAHHHAWFADDESWYALLLGRWTRILERVMLHPPMYRLLAVAEVVTTQALGRMTAPGQFLWDAARDELDDLRRPLTDSKLSSPHHLVAGRHWAQRVDGDPARLAWMFPAWSFPENVESQEQREQRYRAEVLRVFLRAGSLPATNVDAALRPLRAEMGIDDQTAAKVEVDLVSAARAAEADAREAVERGHLATLVKLVHPHDADFPDLKQLLAAVDGERKNRLYAIIEDEWQISHASLAAAAKMDGADFERVMQHLLADPDRNVRKVTRALGKVFYKIPPQRATDALLAAIERVRAQPDLVRGVRPLLEVCKQAFEEDGLVDLQVAVDHVLGQEQPPAATARLLFEAQGQTIDSSSVPDLFREVARRFGKTQALQKKVPFTSGRVRHLVAREPRHAGGHKFISPLPLQDGLVFEANQSRLSALKSLRAWFIAAGLQVDRTEIDGKPIDTEEVGTQTSGTSAPDELELVLRVDGRVDKVTGATAGAFLAGVVSLLYESGKLPIDMLPVRIGRVRYLLAQEPHHANGRPFDSPVQVEGMYIESSLTREDARSHAATLCQSAGVEVIDGDVAAAGGP